VHRTFDSTYCAQTQSAGALAQADPNAILDRHTFELTALAPPAGASGKAVYYCAPSFFTSPVDIRPLLTATPNAEYPPAVVSGGVCSTTSVPCTGLDTDQVKLQMSALAVDFFTRKLARAAGGGVGGTVPATLALTLGPPAAFGSFVPGVAADYSASTTATVTSTAGEATLSVADPSGTAPGRLVNGAFALAQSVQARAGASAYAPVGGSPTPLLAYGSPVSNDTATIAFKQTIGANDALRTGTYSKNLTFTLSTTLP
jgi:hypothetical protein